MTKQEALALLGVNGVELAGLLGIEPSAGVMFRTMDQQQVTWIQGGSYERNSTA